MPARRSRNCTGCTRSSARRTVFGYAEDDLARELPGYASSADSTGVITQRHLDRITAMIEEARASGARGHARRRGRPGHRRLPLVPVAGPPENLRIMRKVVSGPVLL